METVEGTRLVVAEITLLEEILSRRDPDLAGLFSRLSPGPLDPRVRERIRRAVVDELCELPEASGRRALELEEILIRLGRPAL